MRQAFLLLMAALLAHTTGASAGEARQRLDAYLLGLKTLQARFDQSLFDEKGGLLEVSEGAVYLQRPGKFRWDYSKPYEQSIVADGDRIWIYDPDLEQVTVKSMNTALADAPALLLSSEIAIDDEFTVSEDATKEGGLLWLTLRPKTGDNQYADIRLAFDEQDLKLMELSDNFGQRTRIIFSDQQRNNAIEPSLFKFVPPPGVDVLDATEGL